MTQHLAAQSRTTTVDSLQPAARLTVRVGPHSGQEFLLNHQTVTLGSSRGNDLQLPNEHVQRRHARIIKQGNHWTIIDLGWQATYLNDHLVGRAPRALRSGDVIRLGDEVELVFQVDGRAFPLPNLSAALNRLVRLPALGRLPRLPGLDRLPRLPRLSAALDRLPRLPRLSTALDRLPRLDASRLSALAHGACSRRIEPLTRRFDGLRPVFRTRIPPLTSLIAVDDKTVMLFLATAAIGVVALVALAVSFGPIARSTLSVPLAAALPTPTATPAEYATPSARATLISAGDAVVPGDDGGDDVGAPIAQASNCINNSGFEDDVTVPDGTVVKVGSPITKTWRLRNTGTCAWNRGYRLKLIKGDAMGGPERVRVPDTQANESADVSVPLVAPTKAGNYTATWQMVGPDGEGFGWTVSVRIKVVPRPTPTRTRVPTKTPTPTKVPTPTLTPTPGPEVHLWAEQPIIPAGETTTLHVTVQDAAAAWLDGEAVIGGRGDWVISPCYPTTYTLDLQMKNGEHAYRSLAVDVTGACTPTPKPDLAVTYTLNPGRVAKGKPVTLNFAVANQGHSRAEGVDLVFDSGMKGARKVTLASDLAVDPGQTITSTKALAWSASGGYTTTLTVDAGNWIVESDEANNRFQHRLIVK